MLNTRSYKKYNNRLNLYKVTKNNNLVGYSNNLILTNKGFLKSPKELFKNNMCLFIALNPQNLIKDIKIISYSGYIITNNKIYYSNLTDKIINSFVLISILHNILKIINSIVYLYYKLFFYIINYNN